MSWTGLLAWPPPRSAVARAAAFGPAAIFGVGAVYGLLSSAAVLTLRSVRQVTWADSQQDDT